MENEIYKVELGLGTVLFLAIKDESRQALFSHEISQLRASKIGPLTFSMPGAADDIAKTIRGACPVLWIDEVIYIYDHSTPKTVTVVVGPK